MLKKIIIIALSITMLVFLRFAIGNFNTYLKGKSKKNDIPKVKIITVNSQKEYISYEAPGRVVSMYRVTVLTRVAGYLQKTYFHEGSCVKKGDILFLIEPDEYRENANIALADIKKIQAQLDYANKQLIRAQELVKQDYIAKARYDEILSNRNSLSAQLMAAKNKYNDKKRYLQYTTIKAPVEGRIGTIDVTIGNYVTPESGPLTTINSITPMYVTFPVTSDYYEIFFKVDGDNKLKRKVELYFSNGEKYSYEGKQDFFDNEVDQTTGTITFRAIFPNPEDRLLHGEFVKVKIYSNNKINVPVIPVTAVQSNQEGKYVYKLNKDNIAQITYITESGQSGNNLIISKGIKQGDRIIIDGLSKVIPNQKVKIMK